MRLTYHLTLIINHGQGDTCVVKYFIYGSNKVDFVTGLRLHILILLDLILTDPLNVRFDQL